MRLVDDVLEAVFGVERVIRLGAEAKEIFSLPAVDSKRIDGRDQDVDSDVEGVTVHQEWIVDKLLKKSEMKKLIWGIF